MKVFKKLINFLVKLFGGLWVMSLGMGVLAVGFILFPPLVTWANNELDELTGFFRFATSLIPCWFLLSIVGIAAVFAIYGYKFMDSKFDIFRKDVK